MTLGESVFTYRKRKGLTQAELAQILGVTDKAVSKWERGVSCPDITLLPAVAAALGVTADALLSGENPPDEQFISLEKYLMGDYGFMVHDFHPQDEEIALILDSPESEEAEHGYPLSGKAGTELNEYLFDVPAPLTLAELRQKRLGVTYVANVPLLNLEPPLGKLVDELEYTRLNKYHLNRFLLEGFIPKMRALVLSSTVRVIALTRDLNRKYFGAYIAWESPRYLSLLHQKIASGRLEILFVGMPHFWNKPEHKKQDGLIRLKELSQK